MPLTAARMSPAAEPDRASSRCRTTGSRSLANSMTVISGNSTAILRTGARRRAPRRAPHLGPPRNFPGDIQRSPGRTLVYVANRAMTRSQPSALARRHRNWSVNSTQACGGAAPSLANNTFVAGRDSSNVVALSLSMAASRVSRTLRVSGAAWLLPNTRIVIKHLSVHADRRIASVAGGDCSRSQSTTRAGCSGPEAASP